MTRGLKIFLIITLIIVGVATAIWLSPFRQFIQSPAPDYEENKQKFDKTAWAINWPRYKNDENGRHFMLTDLTKNHLKVAMDSLEIKDLLGEPERDFGFSYNLGLYRSGFDPTFLILKFDEHGKLKEIKVETI